MPTVTELLKQTRLFSGLDDKALEHLAQHAQVRRLPKGKTVVVEGETGDTMGVVAEGRVRVVIRSTEGYEADLARIGPSGHFGLVALLDGGARTASIETVEQSTLLMLRRDDIYPLLQTEPRLLERVFEALCGLIRSADVALADQRFLSLKSRVAKALLQSDDGEPGQRITQSELAQRVGATRQSVNQVLRDFERRGFIQYAGRAISIRRAEDLERLAAG
jgi:CRP/FNR family transcriptional regulator, cyclic AMP receptor protein